jgi:hypothetical protein
MNGIYKIPPSTKDNFNSKNQNNYKNNIFVPKYGKTDTTNIEWTYNFDPLKKWITIILCAVALAGSITLLRREAIKHEQIKTDQLEAVTANKQYLERRLETIKQETIAAEQKKIESQRRGAAAISTMKRAPKEGVQVYSWLNEKGVKVYSNQKPSR